MLHINITNYDNYAQMEEQDIARDLKGFAAKTTDWDESMQRTYAKQPDDKDAIIALNGKTKFDSFEELAEAYVEDQDNQYDALFDNTNKLIDAGIDRESLHDAFDHDVIRINYEQPLKSKMLNEHIVPVTDGKQYWLMQDNAFQDRLFKQQMANAEC